MVDDDPMIRRLACRILRGRFEIHLASDGPSALALAERVPFHVAVLDVHMPGCSGVEVARRLLRLPRRPAVLLVSSIFSGACDMAELDIPEGVFACLGKPYDPRSLRDLVSRALAHANPLSAPKRQRLPHPQGDGHEDEHEDNYYQ